MLLRGCYAGRTHGGCAPVRLLAFVRGKGNRGFGGTTVACKKKCAPTGRLITSVPFGLQASGVG